jgi:hypothetical protein
MDDPTYSVKEVAAHIAFRGDPDEIRRIIRQLRHWTNCDLLIPAGNKHTGTGVSRRYDRHEIRKAAILLELSRYGVTVDMLDGFSDWIDTLAKGRDWQTATEGRGDYLIQMSWEPGEDGGAHWSSSVSRGLLMTHKGRKRHGLNVASGIIVNLSSIFRRLGP